MNTKQELNLPCEEVDFETVRETILKLDETTQPSTEEIQAKEENRRAVARAAFEAGSYFMY
jgi:hypothetical protein